MSIFATSDLHYGQYAAHDRSTDALALFVTATGGADDVLLLAGDYGNDDDQVNACLKLFRNFPGHKLAIAGNHDIWVHPREARDSWQRYRDLKQIFQNHGFHSLEDSPVIINDTGFAGSIGWYDYSLGDARGATIEDYRSKIFPGETIPLWNDAHRVRWNFSDESFTHFTEQKLHDQLHDLQQCRSIVVATHHLPTARVLPYARMRWMVPNHWRFANAFLGSRAFGTLFESSGLPIRHVISGHLHTPKTVNRGAITYSVIGSDHQRKCLLMIEDNHLHRYFFDART